ncbi:phage tail protein, partial [Xenorhabdus nematophila]|uniref:phage tail protein n=1 Tax=Xenorhabdus nematophila TaxID=628 RepID=UPI0032B7952B
NLGLAETKRLAENAIPKSEADEKFLRKNSSAYVSYLHIDNKNIWPGITFYSSDGYQAGIEGSGGRFLTIWSDDPHGNRIFNLRTPQKSGMIATRDDIHIPVGVPLPWPHRNPPAGYIECRGQSFPTNQYPLLAQAYPSGALPDLRSEFIRGADVGRGISVLSQRPSQIQSHTHSYRDRYYVEAYGSLVSAPNREQLPAGYNNKLGSEATDKDNDTVLYYDGTTSSTGGAETHPRYVAFLYIVRAA